MSNTHFAILVLSNKTVQNGQDTICHSDAKQQTNQSRMGKTHFATLTLSNKQTNQFKMD